jgi:hypothetical protein
MLKTAELRAKFEILKYDRAEGDEA